jgi:hypothetical protein
LNVIVFGPLSRDIRITRTPARARAEDHGWDPAPLASRREAEGDNAKVNPPIVPDDPSELDADRDRYLREIAARRPRSRLSTIIAPPGPATWRAAAFMSGILAAAVILRIGTA